MGVRWGETRRCGYPITLQTFILTQVWAHTLKLITPYFLTMHGPWGVCFIQTSHFLRLSRCVSMCGGGGSGGGGEGVGVIFLSDGCEGVWGNVKIITCGGREIECEDWLMASCSSRAGGGGSLIVEIWRARVKSWESNTGDRQNHTLSLRSKCHQWLVLSLKRKQRDIQWFLYIKKNYTFATGSN